jgi:predicted O-methyltransferase YrrM
MSTALICDEVYARRPEWVASSISGRDAKFLFSRATASGASTAIEIGTASGTSTAILCSALDTARQEGKIGDDFRVISYDLRRYFHPDPSKAAGAAIHEMLDPELAARVEFRSPAISMTLWKYHQENEIEFLFIDANHDHPWPALDLLAVLDLVRPGAEVALHDINLPVLHPNYQNWGAKHLFDDLDLEKYADEASDPPNIGSVVIPEDKAAVREQLIEIVRAHDWGVNIPEEITAPLLD